MATWGEKGSTWCTHYSVTPNGQTPQPLSSSQFGVELCMHSTRTHTIPCPLELVICSLYLKCSFQTLTGFLNGKTSRELFFGIIFGRSN